MRLGEVRWVKPAHSGAASEGNEGEAGVGGPCSANIGATLARCEQEAGGRGGGRGGGMLRSTPPTHLNEGGDCRIHVVGLENICDQLKAKSVLFLQSVAMR